MKLTAQILLLVMFISGCELFSTRDPEEPDSGRSNYQTPITPNLLISNFQNAFIEKNIENYKGCVCEFSGTNTNHYEFIPSAEARGRYQQLFDHWDINTERDAFQSLSTSLGNENYPQLSLINSSNELTTPDSVIYSTDYTIHADHNNSVSAKLFQGTMKFVLGHDINGLWCIRRWYDTRHENDSTGNTWSILKAQFSN